MIHLRVPLELSAAYGAEPSLVLPELAPLFLGRAGAFDLLAKDEEPGISRAGGHPLTNIWEGKPERHTHLQTKLTYVHHALTLEVVG